MKNRSETILANRIVLSLIAIAALVGGLCARHFLEQSSFKDGIGALCDALFIATFLAIVVDPILKKSLVLEATKDVFSFIYGYSLPPELQHFVNDVILKIGVIRRKCVLEWRVEPKPNHPNEVVLQLNASFLIDNFTNEQRTYQHEVYAWSDSPSDVGCVEDLYCLETIKKNQIYHLRKNEFSPDSNGCVRGKQVTLLSKDTPHGPQYRLGAHYYSESGITGLDQFTFAEATVDVEVKLLVHEALKNLRFSISPVPADGPETVAPVLEGFSGLYECSWNFRRIFMPNETLVIRWQ